MLITLTLENELPVSQTQEAPVSTPSVFVFRGFLFVLLVICKLVEPFCVFFTEFHVPFFLVALSLLLKHSGRRNKNTDLQISVLRAKSWCLTSASRSADFSAPACTSKKSFKSFSHCGWHLLAVQRAKDRSFCTTSAGQEESREAPWAEPLRQGRGLGSSLRQLSRKHWMGRPGKEPHVYMDPLAKKPVWEGFSCSSGKQASIQECTQVCVYIIFQKKQRGAGGGNYSCPKGSWEQPWSQLGWRWVSFRIFVLHWGHRSR